jgi:hypothetical protein
LNLLRKKIVLFILLFLSSTGYLAESHGQTGYRLSWSKELLLNGSGLTLAVLGKYLNQELVPLTQDEVYNLSPIDVNKFDRSASYHYSKSATRSSDVLVGLSVILPASLLVQKKIRNDWETVSVMYMETLLFSNFIPMISKGRIKRIRPYVYNDEVPLEEKLDKNALKSFYSGHTTNAFASAVFISTVYSRYYPESSYKPFIWTSSLSLASLVGYLRYLGGKHFPSDILMGAAVGTVIGFIVPYIHRLNESKQVSLRITQTVRAVGIRIEIYR